MELDDVTGSVVNSAMEVHSRLGPGLLEESYKKALAYELSIRGFHVETEKPLPVIYKGIDIELGYRADLFVENEVIVELKAVQDLAPIHKAQLLTYLKIAQKCVGLLMNFNNLRLKEGLIRMVNPSLR